MGESMKTHETTNRHAIKVKKLMKRYAHHVERRIAKMIIAEVLNEQA